MSKTADILCIGSVLWDIIGRTDLPMRYGNDKPGAITRLPGGVALNIAMQLEREGLTPALLSVVGDDLDGQNLLRACREMGLITDHVLIDAELPTDQYMAIEAQGHLVAAIADAHSLEKAGHRILAPLENGALASKTDPWPGAIVIDGNLTEELLTQIAESPVFAQSDLRIAPASPGKAERLRPFLGHPMATIYVNCEEAGLISGKPVDNAKDAADALITAGAARALVTEGEKSAVDATKSCAFQGTPPSIIARRVTGAGDTFMAAHIAAEARGQSREAALSAAIQTAADYVAGH